MADSAPNEEEPTVKSSGSRLNYALGLFGALIAASVAGTLANNGVDSLFRRSDSRSSEEQIASIKTSTEADFRTVARTIKAQLPIQLSETTSLTAVHADGKSLTYRVVKNDVFSDADVSLLREGIKEELRQYACENPLHSKLVETGGEIVFEFRDNRRFLFASSVTGCPVG